jgi:Amt family ammonium transporter
MLFFQKVSTALVFLMIPALGYFYGGITHRKNLLTALLTTGLGIAVVSIQWFIWGYSLSFSETGSVFIGNFDHVFFINVGDLPHGNAPTIPSNLFMVYQG